MKRFCSWLLFRCLRWRYVATAPVCSKSIICIAPHTSNWDFVIAILFRTATGLKSYFLMKREWFRGPLGWVLRAIGGIPVNRQANASLTETLADLIRRSPHDMHIALTPEGTRSANPTWKRGFYYIARNAGVPIQLYLLNFRDRTIVCGGLVTPSGDAQRDLQTIAAFYRDAAPLAKYPAKFIPDNLA